MNFAWKSATKASISASDTVCVGDDAEQRADRHRLAVLDQPAAEHARAGLSKTLVIFAVSMSAISWPLAIASPSSTSQRGEQPSFIARPHFGMTIGLDAGIAHSAALARSPPPRTVRTAASILAGLGM